MSPKNAFVNGLNPVYLQKNAMFDMMRNPWIWKYFQMNPSVNRQTSFRYPYLGINTMEFIDRLPATTGDGWRSQDQLCNIPREPNRRSNHMEAEKHIRVAELGLALVTAILLLYIVSER